MIKKKNQKMKKKKQEEKQEEKEERYQSTTSIGRKTLQAFSWPTRMIACKQQLGT